MAWRSMDGAQRRPALTALAVCLALLALGTAAGAARASVTQQFLLEDEHHLLELSRGEQLRALEMMETLGVDKIRAVVWWRYMLARPFARRRPPGNPANPASSIYDPDRWAMLDGLVRETRRRGIALMLNPASATAIAGTHLHLPRWAKLRDGSPDADQYGLFVKALARRYNGSYTPAGAQRALPQVHEWSIWNEANNRTFLSPQWRRVDGRTIPWSPVIYRRLYRAAARTLRRNGHRDSRIYFGETMPVGPQLPAPLASMAPTLFVRELACLDGDLRPYSGADAERRGCQDYRPLDTDGLTNHFYSAAEGTAPTLALTSDPSAWHAGEPSRPAGLLALIAERGRLPGGLPVYNTEAGFQSHPIRRPLLTAQAHALSLNVAEYLQWRDPSVHSFAQYLLYDDPFWFTGVRFIDGPPKLAFFALRMPIVVRYLGGGVLEVWGASYGRAAGRVTQVSVNGAPFHLISSDNPRGYFRVTVPGGPASLVQTVDTLTGSRSRTAVATPGL